MGCRPESQNRATQASPLRGDKRRLDFLASCRFYQPVGSIVGTPRPSGHPRIERERFRPADDRVRRGGHHVPDEIVRRRYHVGLRNFLHLYRPMATTWRLYDNSGETPPVLVAKGGTATESRIYDPSTWRSVTRGMDYEAHN